MLLRNRYGLGNKDANICLSAHPASHAVARRLRCYFPGCSQTFATYSKLDEHRLVHMGETSFVCLICHRSFANQKGLYRHKKTHLRNRPTYDCHLCPCSYTRNDVLKRHIKKQHTPTLPSSRSISKDIEGHNNPMPITISRKDPGMYYCDLCPREYRHQSNLRRHVRLYHEVNNTFFCNVCHKYCADKRSLNLHMKSHFCKAGLSCNVCEQKFSRKESLVDHMAIHMSSHPFFCRDCFRRFAKEEHLERHRGIRKTY